MNANYICCSELAFCFIIVVMSNVESNVNEMRSFITL